MHYVSAEGLTKAFGIQPLFENISFHISEGDKIALIARNGTGKSTLLRILTGKEQPDSGKIWIHKDVDVVLLEQDPPYDESRSILDNIFFHPHPVMLAIKEYEAAEEGGDHDKISAALQKMDDLGAWDFDAKVKQVLGKLNIHQLQQPMGTLSGGQRKRVHLARTLIDIGFEHKHVLLLMDEPTNHLDIEMVEWLEHYLDKENVTLLLVTHDRYFLDAVSTEIWEMNRTSLHVYKGDYENYLFRKAAREEGESAGIEKAKNTYRRELEWMRKQPKARTTKSKSRQDNFYNVEKKAKQTLTDPSLQLEMKMQRLGGKIIELKKVNKRYGDHVILKGFDYTFKKGDRIGVVGKNGVGKTTFINIIQELEEPDSGKVNKGDTVIFGYYSQEGLIIKEDLRVIEFVKNIAENFPLASGGSLNAAQFLQLFLFEPDKQFTYISKLSGGEKRRLHLLSILFRNPNFLILDEPTNDLDLPTLGILEEFLMEFSGCLLVVSHDRYFMDRLVDHLFVFEGQGRVRDFPGNYSEYRVWEKENIGIVNMTEAVETASEETKLPAGKKKQLTFNEKREVETLEKEMAALTTEKAEISQKLTAGDSPYDELSRLSLRIGDVTRLLDEKELRWLELNERMV